MEKNNIKKIGVSILLTVLFIMSILSIINIGSRTLYEFGIKNSAIEFLAIRSTKESIDINWKEKYPFEDDNDISKSKIEILKEKVDSIKNEIEERTSTDMILYEKFVEKSYLYDRVIGYTLVSNSNNKSRIKIGDYWCRLVIPPNSVVNIEQKIKNVKEFNEFLLNQNINYIYIQAPSKTEKGAESISPIYYDKSNVYADELLNGIKDEVDYMDLREIIKEKGENYLKLFFKTDHHWKPETGFWATGKIIDKLNNDYNYTIDKDIICDINNYNIKVYKDEYLGSDGRYVTLANTEMEDISLITPKFDTDLTVEIPEINLNKRGSFEETLIDKDQLTNDTNEYNRNHNASYCYQNKALINIHNNNVNNGIKLLVIKDSFANVVTPYLALGVQECSIIDLRHFNGSVKKYIDEYNPDTVINLYYPEELSNEYNELWIYN